MKESCAAAAHGVHGLLTLMHETLTLHALGAPALPRQLAGAHFAAR